MGAARGSTDSRRRRRARDGRARAATGSAPDLTDLNAALAEEISKLFGEPPVLDVNAKPSVLLVVGVNGTGKTTTIGKLAKRLRQHGHSVVLGAADTFRAAAEEQLEIWADRADAEFVGAERGADPASVAYDAIEAATRAVVTSSSSTRPAACTRSPT